MGLTVHMAGQLTASEAFEEMKLNGPVSALHAGGVLISATV
jgi:hypothetical protein